MKLLVFAHTPPPHHGQSYMVQLMLAGFGGDARRRQDAAPHPLGIECYHVNARFSRGLTDVGEFQGVKLFLVLWFCLQALWIRLRYGVDNFYYVPAPGKRVALFRDWLVMFLCRPFFKNVILHWHAAGLAQWLETETTIYHRVLTWRAFRPVNLSIVLSRFNQADAQKLLSGKIIVVPVGIPDPCPRFEEAMLPRRQNRLAARTQPAAGVVTINVLFLALCTREKGVFDAIEGVAVANEQSAGQPLRFHLTLIGGFASDNEKRELHDLVVRRKLQNDVEILGFVPAERKAQAFAEADIFCFPTFYLAENQPGNLIEAMAYGLPVITTRWRSIPEMLPGNYPGLVDVNAPDQIAAALKTMAGSDYSSALRQRFLSRFTLDQHLAQMAEAIRQAPDS